MRRSRRSKVLSRDWRRWWVRGALLILVVSINVEHLAAQNQRQQVYPRDTYYAAFRDYYDGDINQALRQFKSEGRRGLRLPGQSWIDSICYHTMVGECYYQLGQLDEALPQYEAALKLLLTFPDWMIRIQFKPIRPKQVGQIRTVPWGTSQRRPRHGEYQDTYLIGQGQLNPLDVVQKGGALQVAVLLQVGVPEIVRCSTIALRRWRELLGPACADHTMTKELIAALTARPGQPNHWSESWIDTQLGLAQMAGGRFAQAKTALQRAILASGQFDHPLTSTALLALGQIALEEGDFAAAGSFFAEASYAAVQYPNPDIVGTAFSLGLVTHLASNTPGIYPPLRPALQWTRPNSERRLAAQLSILLADNCVALGESRQAQAYLSDARGLLSRKREMLASRLGAQMNFVMAHALFQEGSSQGHAALNAAMQFQRSGSLRNCHIGIIDLLLSKGQLTARSAMDLYGNVLQDPSAVDWANNPFESLTLLMTPHARSFDNWFAVALERNAPEKALEIADLARRHRFYSTLGLGGRLLSLRWALEAPQSLLDPEAVLQRQNLLVRYPAYAALSKQAELTRERLAQLSPAPAAGKELAQVKAGLKELQDLSSRRESILQEMALARMPCEMVFPPFRTTKEISDALPPGQALLAFYETGSQMHAFRISEEGYAHWNVGAVAQLRKEIEGLLRDLGQVDGNREMTRDVLTDERWRDRSAALFNRLVQGVPGNFPLSAQEIVIVPDGILWYLPFEILQVPDGDQAVSLLSRYRVRYAPTVSLAVPPADATRPRARHTAVVTGKLYPRDDNMVAVDEYQRLSNTLPRSVQLQAPLAGPASDYASMFDRLVVYDDLLESGQENPYEWSPIAIDRTTATNTLDGWMRLPFKGPTEIILPGYHTGAENGLKRINPKTAGDEVFLSVCGLMASGARTILLSRWRPAGQSSYDLVREFAQELPHTAPTDAWQRSVQLGTQTPIDLAAEPRVKASGIDNPPTAVHPFFWAGYMLIDTGDPHLAEDEP